MKIWLISGALGAALSFPAAAAVTLTFEAVFTEATRTTYCPLGPAVCPPQSIVEPVHIAWTSSLTFDFRPAMAVSLTEHHFEHPRNGRSVGVYGSTQTFTPDGMTPRTAFEVPRLLPPHLAEPHPITPDLWSAAPVWFSHFMEGTYAGTSRSFNRYDDTGEVTFASGMWTVSTQQRADVSKGTMPTTVSYAESVSLFGFDVPAVTPDNYDDLQSPSDFVDWIERSTACGFCVDIAATSAVSDWMVTGREAHVLYWGTARLTSVQVTPVPEPATWAMSLAGLALLAGVARSRRRAGTR